MCLEPLLPTAIAAAAAVVAVVSRASAAAAAAVLVVARHVVVLVNVFWERVLSLIIISREKSIWAQHVSSPCYPAAIATAAAAVVAVLSWASAAAAVAISVVAGCVVALVQVDGMFWVVASVLLSQLMVWCWGWL